MTTESQDKLKKGTGRSLGEWMDYLRMNGAEDLNELTHKDMARLAEEAGASGWWAQGVAVDVERAIGRRQVGETTSGTVSASASKTVTGEWTEVFRQWLKFVADKGEEAFPSPLEGEPRDSATEKWRYWNVSFADGSRASMTVSDGSTADTPKTKLAIGHDSLGSLEKREPIKDHWKKLFAEFAESLK